MKELKCMHYEEISDVFFPSLKTLFLGYCTNLWGWQRLGNDNMPNDIHNHPSLPPLPRLSCLVNKSCPNLTCMPTFPDVEKLELIYSSVKPIIETCLVQFESSSFYALSKLKNLEIGTVTEVEAMAAEWMKNLISLESLSLWELSLLQHLQHLPSELQNLEIIRVNDNKLGLWDDEKDDNTQCQAPFHCLRSLQRISFYICENLKALPEQIGNIQSLRHIVIQNCRELESLPEAICCLTNLQTLTIIDCPLLRDRCKVETGEDWPKIAHIPKITRY